MSSLPWIIGIVLAFGYFTYFEWRAFAYPEKQVTLSRFVWSIGRGFPLAIFLLGMLCGGLAVHFFWQWCPDLGSINGFRLISPALADDYVTIRMDGSPGSGGSVAPLILPDPKLTPGVARDDITQDNICRTKWGKDARHVTAAMKREVFERYGLTGNTDPACKRDAHGRRCEIDHLISRELGGADDVLNLWPQPYGGQPWNAVRKDRVENRLHKEVCDGNITLEQAQKDILDYRVPYRRYFGEP